MSGGTVSVLVKICGMTNERDVAEAAEAGADALGFIFASSSPRRLSVLRAGRLAARTPAGIIRVGVFQDAAEEDLLAAAEACGLDVIQLHGGEAPALAERLHPYRVWKAVCLEDDGDVAEAVSWPTEAVLADSGRGARRGGTGETGRWDLAARLARRKALVLAGGLHPGNVGEAIRRVRPAWVDASSKLERSMGKKDPALVRAFIKTVRETDGEQRDHE